AVFRHKIGNAVADQSFFNAKRDGLRKGMDLLVADLFFNVIIQETGAQKRILGFLENKAGGCLYRKFIQLFRRCPAIQTAYRFGRDSQAVDARQIDTTAGDGPHNLVYIDWLKRSVSLANLHCRLRIFCLSGRCGGGLSYKRVHYFDKTLLSRFSEAGRQEYFRVKKREKVPLPASRLASEAAVHADLFFKYCRWGFVFNF